MSSSIDIEGCCRESGVAEFATTPVIRHPNRADKSPIIEYHFNHLMMTSNLSLDLPESFKMVFPKGHKDLIGDDLTRLKLENTKNLEEFESKRKNWELQLEKHIKYDRVTSFDYIKYGVIGFGVVAVLITLAYILWQCLRNNSKSNTNLENNELKSINNPTPIRLYA